MNAPRTLHDTLAERLSGEADGTAADTAGDLDWLERLIALTIEPGRRNGGGERGGPSAAAMPLERIVPPAQPGRRAADPEGIARLAASIAEHGILQPLLVRPAGTGFEIVVGQRRYLAARLVGLREVPAIVLPLADREALMVSLIENLQRDDIAPLDEAQCYYRLLDELGWTQDELARRVGRSRSHIANTLRLLALPPEVKRLVEDGALSAGHARALLGTEDPVALAECVTEQQLSVRETEALAEAARPPDAPARPRLDTELSRLEQQIAAGLGLTVRLHPSRSGGRLTIYYRSPEELEAALRNYGSAAVE